MDEHAFRYFNVKTSHWEVEGGAAYKVMAEASRTEIRFSSPIAIKEADTTYDLSVLPYHVAEEIRQVTY